MRLKTIILILLICVQTALSSPQIGSSTLKSPDGNLVITFETVDGDKPSPAGGKLVYAVSFRGKQLIDRSALSLELQGQRPLGGDVRIVKATPSEADETYRLIVGKTSSVRNRYNALRIEME